MRHPPYVWKFQTTHLSNPCIKERIPMDSFRFGRNIPVNILTGNKTSTYQNFGNMDKALLKEQGRVLNAHMRKEEGLNVNTLSLHFRRWVKYIQRKLKERLLKSTDKKD
jgi:hypothetical protein